MQEIAKAFLLLAFRNVSILNHVLLRMLLSESVLNFLHACATYRFSERAPQKRGGRGGGVGGGPVFLKRYSFRQSYIFPHLCLIFSYLYILFRFEVRLYRLTRHPIWFASCFKRQMRGLVPRQPKIIFGTQSASNILLARLWINIQPSFCNCLVIKPLRTLSILFNLLLDDTDNSEQLLKCFWNIFT